MPAPCYQMQASRTGARACQEMPFVPGWNPGNHRGYDGDLGICKIWRSYNLFTRDDAQATSLVVES